MYLFLYIHYIDLYSLELNIIEILQYDNIIRFYCQNITSIFQAYIYGWKLEISSNIDYCI